MEDLIEKEVIGFKFTSHPNFVPLMKAYVGKIGKIKKFYAGIYCVEFDDGHSWNYPYPEILEHLVEKQVVEKELTLEEIFDKIKNLTP